jgi:cytochrome oxidase Cu insertion factor (SCO1/SenC/PrrC family)
VTKVAIEELAPSERDPAKIRKTSAILLVIMLIGGVMIMAAYLVKRKEDLAADRPSIRGRLTSNLALVNDRKETVNIGQLEGSVWLATQVCLSEPDQMKRAIEAMQWLETEFAGREDMRFVCLTIDPNRDVPEKLAGFRAQLGVGDHWWFVAAGEEPIRRYIKNQMKLGDVRVEDDGAVSFDSMVLLVDRHLHIRPAYDFNQAWSVEDAARRLIKEEPDRIEEFQLDFGAHPKEFLGQTEKLREELRRDVEQVLTEDLTSEQEKSSS